MNKMQSIIAYLAREYPHKHELSKARLTKLVYLADWFSSLVDGRQMTDIEWLFNHYGPYVEDVFDAANQAGSFNVEQQSTLYGSPKWVVSYVGDEEPDLSARERKILDAVIKKTERLYFNQFMDYVYSTYPIKASERYTNLNLIALAEEFKEKVAREQQGVAN